MKLKEIGKIKEVNEGFIIQIHDEYKEALTGLEEFSHMLVLWAFHLIDHEPNEHLLMNSPYVKGPDTMGTFATRSPIRPNPIGLTTCSIIKINREDGIIHLPYIDALDGTPVLDIKPYEGCLDRVRDLNPPAWCKHWPKYLEESGHFDWSKEFNF